MITAELSGEAEMLIRTEGCVWRYNSQGQRIEGEKPNNIIPPRGRGTEA